jgi:hypothetical protein
MLFEIWQGTAEGYPDKLMAITPEAFAEARADAELEDEHHEVTAEDWFESWFHGNVEKIGVIEMTGSTDILHSSFPINAD